DLQALILRWRDAQYDTGKAQANYSAAVEASNNGNILAVSDSVKAVVDARAQLGRTQQDLDKRIQDFDKKIDEKNQKKEELLVRYQPEYKEVKAIVSEIAELEKQKKRVVEENTKQIKDQEDSIQKTAKSEVLASLKATLSAAQQKEAKLRSSLDQTAAKANIDGQAETTIVGQQRELASNRALLDSLRQRQKEQQLAFDTDAPKNIKIQNDAVVPTTPIGPARGRNILVALFLSLGAGVGLAFLLDFLDDSVRTSDDITRHLGLPTLALIPHHLNSDKKKLLATTNGNANGSGSPASSALIRMDERNSPMAEAYRHLRTSLLFSSAGKPPQTILITSSQPSEGKTTTAINTAITLAQGDVDVVIIDCDLRRPRLHSHFGMENTSGLTNYLSGDKNTEHLMKTYKDLPRLKVITSGPIPPNPAELLSSNEMRNLLTFLSGRFKHIIIDSPPAISFTDASILSTLVDGVVLVAMANKSSIHLMKQFKQRVTAIGARIYGVVLNGIKSNSEEYYYYGSGYYNYYSQADDDESTPRMEETPKVAPRDTEV
ncbi:MAG TPA: polysaccharide biosynthesis tyrosine autokinase, partial [Pyrinomonadaceae bacterium]|nr:polysaccharide biosynthesis tyrosine autokinase [Pyrinomonadaceae bacterium]